MTTGDPRNRATEHGGLGRRVAPDARDREFAVAEIVPAFRTAAQRKQLDAQTLAAIERGVRNWWNATPNLDQGFTPRCVGFSWAHWLSAGPVTQRQMMRSEDAAAIYSLAQQLDEWPGDAYDGTSVRGGAKALRQLGRIAEFRWAFTLDELVNAVLTLGPVVFGTWWTEGMDEPKNGVLNDSGERLGGHAYMIVGVNKKTRQFRVKNSWGTVWGDKGRAWLPFDAAERLLSDDGEACIATEIRK